MFTSNPFVLNPIMAFFVVDSSRKEIVAGAIATFLAFQLRNTKVVPIAVFQIVVFVVTIVINVAIFRL